MNPDEELEAAWAEAEAALPKDWRVAGVRRNRGSHRWIAAAVRPANKSMRSLYGGGPTASAALRALASEMRAFVTALPVEPGERPVTPEDLANFEHKLVDLVASASERAVRKGGG